MNRTNLYHAAFALAMQAGIGLLSGDWWTAAAFGMAFFLGREVTQSEYHWITKYGNGKRAAMPWWGGFDPRAWTLDGLLDWLVPTVAVVAVAWVFGT